MMIARAPLVPERVNVFAHLKGSFMATISEVTLIKRMSVVIAKIIKISLE